MSNEEKKNPINLLTEALANMTLAAMEAQRERDMAERRGDEWYKRFTQKEAEHKELQSILAAELKGHRKTKMDLEQALEACEKLTDEIMQLKNVKK